MLFRSSKPLSTASKMKNCTDFCSSQAEMAKAKYIARRKGNWAVLAPWRAIVLKRTRTTSWQHEEGHRKETVLLRREGCRNMFFLFSSTKKMQKNTNNLSGIIQVSSNLSRYSSSLSSFSEYHDCNILKTASRSHGTRWPVSGFRWSHMQQKQFDFRTLKPLSWLLRFCTLRMTPMPT